VTQVFAAVRRVLFWVHLSSGVVAGAVILSMSVTGVAMTYQRQVQAWADRGAWRPPSGAVKLSPAALVARIQDQQPQATVTSVTIRQDPDALAAASVAAGGPAASIQVDPYTGAIVPPGPRAAAVRSFFSRMNAWHRWLGRTGDTRDTGRSIVGIANLMFFVIVVTGTWLWWPRQLTARAFAAVMWFRRGLSGRARDFNWHATLGFLCVVPLLVVVGAGVVMSFPWANDLVYRVAGDAPPPRAAGPGGRGGGEGRARAGGPVTSSNAGIDEAARRAGEIVTDWRSLAITLPSRAGGPITVSVDSGDGGQPQRRSTVAIDGATGAVAKVEGFATQSTGRRWRSLLRFAHTGEVFGVGGQTVAGLASLGGVVLVCTGMLMSTRRAYRWLTRQPRSEPPASIRPAA